MTDQKMHAPGYPNLKPGRGRPSPLANPDFVKAFSEFVANGLSRPAIRDAMLEAGLADVKDLDTITRWKRDPRVKATVSKLIEDRALDISRTIDSKIAGILSQAGNLSIKDLLAIRKEYGGAVVQRTEVGENVTAEAIQHMEDNPEFVEALEALLSGSSAE